jgi:hypothetical protein
MATPLQRLQLFNGIVGAQCYRLMQQEIRKHCAEHAVDECKLWIDDNAFFAALISQDSELEIEIPFVASDDPSRIPCQSAKSYQ